MDCPACARIAAIRRGEEPALVAELPETFVLLAEEQRYEGWCVLFLKEHAEHLAALPIERQGRIFLDVARVGRALTRAFGPRRLNFECLGNLLHHIHWHVIPRYAWDPDPTATIWVRPASERPGPVASERRAELIARVRKGLGE